MKQHVSATGTTHLRQQGEKKVIAKVARTPVESAKLEYQHEWLKARERLPHLPKVVAFHTSDSGVTLELAYFPNSVPFFELIHEPRGLERAEPLLERVLDFLDARIHLNPTDCASRGDLDRYVQEKVLGKLKQCEAILPGFKELSASETLVVNGRTNENARVIIDRICADEALMQRLARIERCALHGDPTVDNIVVARDASDFLVLDPNGENHLSDRLIDYAKLSQSLNSGYEFLCRLTEVSVSPAQGRGVKVDFDAAVSNEYRALSQALDRSLSRRLSPDRVPLVRFYEAVHFARMLPYKAQSNPETFGAFYATMVTLFNEFYRQAR